MTGKEWGEYKRASKSELQEAQGKRFDRVSWLVNLISCQSQRRAQTRQGSRQKENGIWHMANGKDLSPATQLCYTFDFGCLSQGLADVTISHKKRIHTSTLTHTERQPPAPPVTTYINKQWRTDMRIGGSSRSSSCERQAQPDTSLSLSNQGHFICTHSHRSVKREAHSARAVKVRAGDALKAEDEGTQSPRVVYIVNEQCDVT